MIIALMLPYVKQFFLRIPTLSRNKNCEKNYAIYQPNTPTLRGTSPDKYQTTPLGLCGGRLAEAIEELLHEDEAGDIKFGELYIEVFLSQKIVFSCQHHRTQGELCQDSVKVSETHRTSLLFQLIKPYRSLQKKIAKLTTTGR